MSIKRNPTPINRDSLSTAWFSGTGDRQSKLENFIAAGAFLLACGATLTIWNSHPFVRWSYEMAVFLLAAIGSLRRRIQVNVSGAIMACISLWGLAQLCTGAAVYRWITLNASLQNAACAATALAGFLALRQASLRAQFLRGVVWFGLLVSVLSVLAYFTSPGQILWVFPAQYPDNWGPFPSRNNFAQFLELCFPVALYQMAGKPMNAIAPAVMLAAGLASASRAGALLLVLEMLAGIFLLGKEFRRLLIIFSVTTAGLIGVVGASALWGRLKDPDPLKYRREIFHSSVAMISAQPWKGYGLGTFSTVYPEFAAFDSGASVEHAHNDWLEWAAEGGVPFAILWAALAIRLTPLAIRSFWGIGVLAVFLHALVDYPFARLGVGAWEFLLIGALLAERSASHRVLKLQKWSIP